MPKESIKTTIRGIKCDNPSCDYKDMSIPFEDYPNWVNKPCPCCGENLLTESDYKRCLTIMNFTSALASLFPVPDDYDGSEDVIMTMNWDDGMAISKTIPTDTYNPEKPENNRFADYFNKQNAEWLENELIRARKQGIVRNINEIDTETLKYLVYGYNFTDDHLAYIFDISKREAKKIREQQNVYGSGLHHTLFKSENDRLYNVDEVYNKCIAV